jgi:hypothetical protein
VVDSSCRKVPRAVNSRFIARSLLNAKNHPRFIADLHLRRQRRWAASGRPHKIMTIRLENYLRLVVEAFKRDTNKELKASE